MLRLSVWQRHFQTFRCELCLLFLLSSSSVECRVAGESRQQAASASMEKNETPGPRPPSALRPGPEKHNTHTP